MIAKDGASPAPLSDLVIQEAHALAPMLREHAERVDRERRVSDEVYQEIRRRGLLNVLKPKAYGGYELGPYEHAMVTMNLARGCGSTAWVYSLLNSDNLFVAAFPKEAQDEVWADPEATVAGSLNLNRTRSRAERTGEGYRLSGTFSFCSGSDQADWIVFAAQPEGEDARIFLMPKAECELVDDWFTLGMRGTGSRTYKVHDRFVPAHRVILASELFAPESRLPLHPTFDVLQAKNGFAGMFLLPSVAVGVALGALEFVAATGRDQQRVGSAMAGGSTSLVGSEAALVRFAESAAEVEQARAYIEHKSQLASRRVAERRGATAEELLAEQRDQSHITHTMVRAVDRLHRMLGSKACFEGHPVGRALRDAQTTATHVVLNWDRVAAAYARDALGVA